MRFIEYIFSFFRKIFNRKQDIKMIEAPVAERLTTEKTEFQSSLKVSMKINKKIETLTCFGDGLGIQNSIKY